MLDAHAKVEGRIFNDRCRSCGRPFPCRDCLSDRDTDRWVAEHAPGTDVPKENGRRLLGGNLDRTDRGDPQELLRGIEARRDWTKTLAAYNGWIHDRRRALEFAIRCFRAESSRLGRHAKFLALRYDGEGLEFTAIAARLGFKSHTPVSALAAEVDASAVYVLRRGAGAAVVECEACGGVIVPHEKANAGRFCNDTCAARFSATVRRRMKANENAHARRTGAATVKLHCRACPTVFEFTPTAEHTKPPRYCSHACRLSEAARRMRERRARGGASVPTTTPPETPPAVAVDGHRNMQCDDPEVAPVADLAEAQGAPPTCTA